MYYQNQKRHARNACLTYTFCCCFYSGFRPSQEWTDVRDVVASPVTYIYDEQNITVIATKRHGVELIPFNSKYEFNDAHVEHIPIIYAAISVTKRCVDISHIL